MRTINQRGAQGQTGRAAGQVPKAAVLCSRRVALTVHATQLQQQRQPTPQPQHKQQHQSSRGIAEQAVATETVTATATTALPGWLKSLLPFGRKQAAPLIPTISRVELDSLLQALNGSAEACNRVPLVVIFSATWCGPCRVMTQRMENIAKQLGPRGVQVVKIDTGPNDGKAAVQVDGVVKESVLLDMVLHKSQFMGNDMAGCMKW